MGAWSVILSFPSSIYRYEDLNLYITHVPLKMQGLLSPQTGVG